MADSVGMCRVTRLALPRSEAKEATLKTNAGYQRTSDGMVLLMRCLFLFIFDFFL